jgi:3-oxoadipate enol-lactonase
MRCDARSRARKPRHDARACRANTQRALHFIKNGDLSLAFERRGTGPRALLFAHGWISSRRMFHDVVDRLDLTRVTASLMDFRGMGLSDRSHFGHDLEGYASDLRAALAATPGDVELIAHSMGAKVAQYVALDPPPNLRRLVLVAPGSAHAYPTNATHRKLTEAAFGSRERIEQFQRAAMTRAVSAESMERIVDDALLAERNAWFGWYDTGRLTDFSARLAAIALPTLVVAGERDPLAPPARVRREVGGGIRGSRFLSLRDVGHNVPIEAATELAQIIERLPPL